MGTGRPHDTAVLRTAVSRVVVSRVVVFRVVVFRVVVACTVAATVAAGCTSEPGDEQAPPPPPANLAFIDVEATSAVSEQIGPAVKRFFSYDYQRIDEHLSETMADTTPRYWTEVEPSLRIVGDVAPRRQIVASADVVATSVRLLEPNRAELLLFVNRRTTEGTAAPQLDASSVVVKAARTGPLWKIDGMTVS